MRKQKKTPAASEVLKPLIHTEEPKVSEPAPALGKKFTVIYGAVLLFFVIVYLASSVLTGVYPQRSGDLMRITLYFVNSAQNTLAPETRRIETPSSNRELINAAMRELLETGPQTAGHTRIYPRETRVVESAMYIERDRICVINLTPAYYELPAREQLFTRSAVTMTLTEYNFVDGVIFLCENDFLYGANGGAQGVLSRENMSLNPALSPLRSNTRTITLYFIDRDGAGLIPEERSVEVLSNIEYHIVEQLINGPVYNNASPALAGDLTLKSAETTDGICYVDFGPGFVSRQFTGDYGDLLAVYSIVNSLTELNSVQKVQIIVDSATISEVIGDVDLGIPLSRNEDIIR